MELNEVIIIWEEKRRLVCYRSPLCGNVAKCWFHLGGDYCSCLSSCQFCSKYRCDKCAKYTSYNHRVGLCKMVTMMSILACVSAGIRCCAGRKGDLDCGDGKRHRSSALGFGSQWECAFNNSQALWDSLCSPGAVVPT